MSEESDQADFNTLGGHASAKRVTTNVLYELREKLKYTTSDLEKCLQKIDNKMQTLSSAEISREVTVERKRVQQEKESIKQCIAICTQAYKEAEQVPADFFEDVLAAKGVS